MPDAFARIASYRDRSEECLRLADVVAEKDLAPQYRALAMQYRWLVETELKLVDTMERIRSQFNGNEL
jgi:hypothetical protein